MKDGDIAKVVNGLRDIAKEFHGAQQLRERIARVIVPLLAEPVEVRAAWELLQEAHDYAQFAKDNEQPQAEPVLKAIRTIIDHRTKS